jgi:type IV secretory pathway VirB2 component (pilin)
MLPIAGSLADPPPSSVLAPAVSWLEGTLLGTVATSAAVIAMAATGYMMLSGRIDARRGLAVVLGCFVLAGASTIAAGIGGAGGDPGAAARAEMPPTPAPAPALAPTAPSRAPAAVYDPHAGASVPPD